MSNRNPKAGRKPDQPSIPAAGATTVPVTAKKKWSKWLKVIGAALLLTAFGMQMRQNQKAAVALERMQAAELDGRANMRALEHENLYFSEKLATGLEDGSQLNQAAQQYYEGRVSMMSTSPADRAEVTASLAKLRKAGGEVHDLVSFNKFMAVNNTIIEAASPGELAGLIDPDHEAKHLGQLYLALYVIGTIAAILGQILD